MSAAAIPDTIDLEKLLAPISDEQPAGEYLRYEGTYDQIRDARREDDATLTQGIYKTDLKKANWKEVERICTEALLKYSKDVQIAAYLTEAWLHLRGFTGCRDGLQVLNELLEKFWDDVHPQPSQDNMDGRIGTFVWINEKLSLQLKLIPVTSPQSGDLLPYSVVDWERACRLEQLTQQTPGATAGTDSQVTLLQFQSSALLTPTQSYVEIFNALDGIAEACSKLDGLLDEKLGKQSPGMERFKETLGDIQRLVSDILHARPEEPEFSSPSEDIQLAAESREPGPEIWSTHPIRSRSEAYWRLSEAAEYLLRTEPHSPTPYLVKRAVEWGSMSLSELLQQIVRNEGEMQEINRLLRLTNKEGGG